MKSFKHQITDFNYIYQILKEAAKDIPEFYPEWVRTYPLLEDYDTLSRIPKSIPVEDYREQIAIDQKEFNAHLGDDIGKSLTNLIKSTVSQLSKLESLIMEKAEHISDIEIYRGIILNIKKQIKEINIKEAVANFLNDKKISEVLVLRDEVKEAVVTPSHPLPKTLRYPAGVSLVKILNVLANDFEKYLNISSKVLNNFKNYDSSDEFKDLNYFVSRRIPQSKREDNNKYEVVFSKQPSDLLSMSIRADWTSCQDLLRDENDDNIGAIYSAISPYVGIIYLTNKKNYENMGEEMVARSLVFYLKSGLRNDPILYINKVYSNYDKKYIENIFKQSLQEKSSLRVFSQSSFSYSIESEYYLPYESIDEDTFKPRPVIPYLDDKIQIRRDLSRIR